MADKRDYSKVKVIHKMADGSVRDSLEGYTLQYENLSLTARELIRKMITEKPCPK